MNQVIFKRAAWRRVNGEWKPFVGRKTYVTTVGSVEEARRICKKHNDERTSRGDTFCEWTVESNY